MQLACIRYKFHYSLWRQFSQISQQILQYPALHVR